ncbi:MAG TPA: hypothetical protein VMK32_06145 [Burkholderiaceae bacterium]|nr:hypothetical protein [Burkholderiaceae bacterium]
MSDSQMQRVGWVVWPAFLVACAAELLFFSLFDPSDLHLFGHPVEVDRMLVYTLGFFALWGIGIVSSALTVFLARSPFEVNRCTMLPGERPDGCPKREGVSEQAIVPLERS